VGPEATWESAPYDIALVTFPNAGGWEGVACDSLDVLFKVRGGGSFVRSVESLPQSSEGVLMRRWSWVAAVVVVASACGGGTSDSDAAAIEVSAAATVESSDGLASLSFPPGSLPDGMSAGDVQVQVVIDESPEPGIATVAVQLSPDGLALAQDAALTVVLPETLHDGLIAIHSSGDTIEFVTGDIENNAGVVSFTTPIRHFSRFHLFKPAFELSVVGVPEQLVEGETHTVNVTLTNGDEPFSFWYHLAADPEGTARLFTFSPPQPPFEIDMLAHWGKINQDSQGLWSPEEAPVDIERTSTGWKGSASSICQKRHSASPSAVARLNANWTLVERGEPVTNELYQFGQLSSPSEATTLTDQALADRDLASSDRELVGVKLSDASPGDSIRVHVHRLAYTAVECVGAAASSTSTSTSTTQPASEESDDLTGVGDGGEVRDAAWHYAQGLTKATANLEAITDCAELTALYEAFSGMIGVDQNDPEAVQLALALDEIAWLLRRDLGC